MFIDLAYQVKSFLGLENGGLDNRLGLARGVIFQALNGSGASLAVGSTVKRAAYNYPVVTPTTTTDELVLGVTVGRMTGASDRIDPNTASAANEHAAVATAGIVSVRLGANVTAGEYAFAHATDGTAYSSATAAPEMFGVFLTSGTSGSTARVHLTGTQAGGVGDAEFADHSARHEAGGADALAIDAAAATGSLRTIGSGALQAAAGNHAHAGMLLLADGRATPFTFNDVLQMDDGSDFMWSDPA